MNISVLVHRTIVEELIKGESYMKRIEEYCQKNYFPEKDIVAWC